MLRCMLLFLTLCLSAVTAAQNPPPTAYVDNQSPRWSPDGLRLLFNSKRDGNLDLYSIGVDGAGLTRLTDHAADDQDGSWSPDGTRIVFSSNRDGGRHQIHVMDADGSNVRRITDNPFASRYPSWSPDGAALVFNSSRGMPYRQVFRIGADGAGQAQLTAGLFHNDWPSYSSDGTSIIFESDRTGIWCTVMMKADGAEQVLVTPAQAAAPDLAPDGTRIVFHSDRDGAWNIYTMGVDGGRAVALTFGGANTRIPSWSPDGSRIAFSSNRTAYEEIYVMRADGSDLEQLTRQPDGELTRLIRDQGLQRGQERYRVASARGDAASLFRPAAMVALADDHGSTGDHAAAGRLLAMAREAHPDSGLALIRSAELLDAAGKREEAHEQYRSAMTTSDAIAMAYDALGPSRATKLLEDLRQDGALREAAVNSLGYALLGRGEHDAAVTVLRINVEAFPGSSNVWDSYGEALAAAGDPAGAVVSYRKSLVLDPENRNAEVKLRALGARP